MNIKMIAGIILLLIPFAGIFVCVVVEEGFLMATAIFAGAFVLSATILLGTYLLCEGFFD